MSLNDTHRETLCFCSVQYKNGYLAPSDLFHMFKQSVKFYTFYYHVLKDDRYLRIVIHQIDRKNECFLLSASFMTKFGLLFVLRLENSFFRGFILKPTERA